METELLKHLATEQPNERASRLDVMGTEEIVKLITDEDRLALEAVHNAVPDISRAVEFAADRWRRGGRVILIGAGTSGRLAALDASEIPPTYGTSPERYAARVAGGTASLSGAREGSEDDVNAGTRAAADLRPEDVAFGLAASGRTPFVLSALREAQRRGAGTIGLACVAEPALGPLVTVGIILPTGPEVVAGSTRMKAGTAQKMALTAFSTALMVRVGNVYRNLMVGMRPRNAKLRARATRLIQEVTGTSPSDACAALDTGHGDIKIAILTLTAGLSREAAERKLAEVDGNLRQALDSMRR